MGRNEQLKSWVGIVDPQQLLRSALEERRSWKERLGRGVLAESIADGIVERISKGGDPEDWHRYGVTQLARLAGCTVRAIQVSIQKLLPTFERERHDHGIYGIPDVLEIVTEGERGGDQTELAIKALADWHPTRNDFDCLEHSANGKIFAPRHGNRKDVAHLITSTGEEKTHSEFSLPYRPSDQQVAGSDILADGRGGMTTARECLNHALQETGVNPKKAEEVARGTCLGEHQILLVTDWVGALLEEYLPQARTSATGLLAHRILFGAAYADALRIAKKSGTKVGNSTAPVRLAPTKSTVAVCRAQILAGSEEADQAWYDLMAAVWEATKSKTMPPWLDRQKALSLEGDFLLLAQRPEDREDAELLESTARSLNLIVRYADSIHLSHASDSPTKTDIDSGMVPHE